MTAIFDPPEQLDGLISVFGLAVPTKFKSVFKYGGIFEKAYFDCGRKRSIPGDVQYIW